MNIDYLYPNNDWDRIIREENEKLYFQDMISFVESEYKTYTVFPPKEDIMTALRRTSPEKVKVLILGQDPYINKNQAHGLAFSVNMGEKIPPSLKNIYEELSADLGIVPPTHGCLISWAEQGVLLLNTVLTVREGKSNSHKNKGWEIFTDVIIKYLAEKLKPMVFVLWGNSAQKKSEFIKNPDHLVIKSPHPSPLSAAGGFFGSKPFSRINEYLLKNNLEPVRWV